MQLRLAISLLTFAFASTACDQITGEASQKAFDAEAIGYACRVSMKKPEDCMKDNESQSPNSILTGWRSADKDITDGKLDPQMSNTTEAQKLAAATAADKGAQSAPEGGTPTLETKPDKTKTPEVKPAKSH